MNPRSSITQTVVPLLVFLFTGFAAAGDFPGAVRIAAAGGHFVAGVQMAPGTDGAFELFAGHGGGSPVLPLGRFNGRLAGVAVDEGGRPLALTGDGALGVYDNDPRALALPDSRWHMLALALWNGRPVAVTHDADGLHLVRPGADQNWNIEERAALSSSPPSRAELVPDGPRLHLFWTGRPGSLAGGGIHHAVRGADGWEEREPLMFGNAAGFCAFADGRDVRLVARIADPLNAAPGHIVSKALRDGVWTDIPLSGVVLDALEDSPLSFAAAMDAGAPGGGTAWESLWLVTGADGAALTRVGSTGAAGREQLVSAGGASGSGLGPRITSLVTIVLMGVLMLMYCRRSRALSVANPERPPDLLSRAAALGVDWMLASIAMTAYHVASGDVRILPDLLMQGRVEGIFWANLGGLALFMFISEAAFGCTPGKYLAGLHVRSIFGGRAGVMQTALRNFLRVVDMYPFSGAFPGLIGAVATFLNKNRQRVGDMLAGTVVRRHLPLDRRGFLLASASPRRLELLNELGVKVRVEVPDIDEDAVKGESPEETVRLLAEAKARAMADRAKPPELVVAADTIVVLDGEIMGKPADAQEARAMLGRLSGRSHSVFTGVTVWDPGSGRALADVEETEVEFHTLTPRDIDMYVATGDPLDKAGAYGVQSGRLVKQVRGSLSNVAGLPMEKLQSMIEHLGV